MSEWRIFPKPLLQKEENYDFPIRNNKVDIETKRFNDHKFAVQYFYWIN